MKQIIWRDEFLSLHFIIKGNVVCAGLWRCEIAVYAWAYLEWILLQKKIIEFFLKIKFPVSLKKLNFKC